MASIGERAILQLIYQLQDNRDLVCYSYGMKIYQLSPSGNAIIINASS